MFENFLGDNDVKIYQGIYFTTAEPKCAEQEIIDSPEECAIGVTNET